MKIKNSFVTNSSSTCYVLTIEPDMLDKLMDDVLEMEQHPDITDGCSLSYIFKDKNEIDNYCNDGELDWVSKVTGPKFINMTEELYNSCKDEILNKRYICILFIDYNICDYFENLYHTEIISAAT